jgi:hypothetical protein
VELFRVLTAHKLTVGLASFIPLCIGVFVLRFASFVLLGRTHRNARTQYALSVPLLLLPLGVFSAVAFRYFLYGITMPGDSRRMSILPVFVPAMTLVAAYIGRWLRSKWSIPKWQLPSGAERPIFQSVLYREIATVVALLTLWGFMWINIPPETRDQSFKAIIVVSDHVEYIESVQVRLAPSVRSQYPILDESNMSLRVEFREGIPETVNSQVFVLSPESSSGSPKGLPAVGSIDDAFTNTEGICQFQGSRATVSEFEPLWAGDFGQTNASSRDICEVEISGSPVSVPRLGRIRVAFPVIYGFLSDVGLPSVVAAPNQAPMKAFRGRVTVSERLIGSLVSGNVDVAAGRATAASVIADDYAVTFGWEEVDSSLEGAAQLATFLSGIGGGVAGSMWASYLVVLFGGRYEMRSRRRAECRGWFC